MADQLCKVKFSLALLPSVQGFRCGDTPCGLMAAKWLTDSPAATEDCALAVMEKYGTDVWLYKNNDGNLVAFASLGPSEWRAPTDKSPKRLISVIPWLGIRPEFQRQPAGADRDQRYSTQIMIDLIGEAEAHPERKRFIGLCVHRGNVAAIRLYERLGFVPREKPYRDPDTGIYYNRMILELQGPSSSGM